MKAVICEKYGPPEVLKIAQAEKPVPKAGEVLVRVKAAALAASGKLKASIDRVFPLVLAIAVSCPLSADGLLGIGLGYGWDMYNIYTEVPAISTAYDSMVTSQGLCLDADLYLGQRTGFYAGGSIGLLSRISRVTVTTTPTEEVTAYGDTDMGQLSTKLFGEALLGMGLSLPLAGWLELLVAGGLGCAFMSTKQEGVQSTDTLFSAGPGIAAAIRVPVFPSVEVYLSVRSVLGLIRLGDFPDYYKFNFTVTDALGVKIKF